MAAFGAKRPFMRKQVRATDKEEVESLSVWNHARACRTGRTFHTKVRWIMTSWTMATTALQGGNDRRTKSAVFPHSCSYVYVTFCRKLPSGFLREGKSAYFTDEHGGRTRDRTLDLSRVKLAPDARRLFVAV